METFDFNKEFGALDLSGEETIYEDPNYTTEQRGIVGDTMSSLASGSGNALGIFASAVPQLSFIRDAADAIRGTDIAKMDLDTKYGQDSKGHEILSQIVEGIPLVGATMVAPLVGGALAGPAGAVAGGAASLGVIQQGSYHDAYDEVNAEYPDLDEDTKKDFATTTSLWEAIPEIATMITGGTASALMKGGGKKAIIAQIAKGVITPKDVLEIAIKKQGVKKVSSILFGTTASEAVSEGLTWAGQDKARQEVGLESQSSLGDAMIVGGGLGLLLGGAGATHGSFKASSAGKQLASNLQSENQDVRVRTSKVISDALDPSVKKLWDTKYAPRIAEGVITLDQIDAMGKAPATKSEDLNSILDDPEGVVERATGIKLADPSDTNKVAFKEKAEEREAKIVPEVTEPVVSGQPTSLFTNKPTEKDFEKNATILEKARQYKDQVAQEEAVRVEQEKAKEAGRQDLAVGLASYNPEAPVSPLAEELAVKGTALKRESFVKPTTPREAVPWEETAKELASYNPELPTTMETIATEANVEVTSVAGEKFTVAAKEIIDLREYATAPTTSMAESAKAIKEADKIQKEATVVAKGVGTKIAEPVVPKDAVNPLSKENTAKDAELRAKTEADHARLFPALDFVLRNKKELIDIPNHLEVAEAIVDQGGTLSIEAIRGGMPQVARVTEPKVTTFKEPVIDTYRAQLEIRRQLEDPDLTELEIKKYNEELRALERNDVAVDEGYPEKITKDNDVEDYDARSDTREVPKQDTPEYDVSLTDLNEDGTHVKGKRVRRASGHIVENRSGGNAKRRVMVTTPENLSYTTSTLGKVNEAIASGDYSKLRPYTEKNTTRSDKATVSAKNATPESIETANAFLQDNEDAFKRMKDKGSVYQAAHELSATGTPLTVPAVKVAAEAAHNRLDSQGKLKGTMGGDALLGVGAKGEEVSSAPKVKKKVKEETPEVKVDSSKKGTTVGRLSKEQLRMRKASLAITKSVKLGEMTQSEGRMALRELQSNPESANEFLEERTDTEDFAVADDISDTATKMDEEETERLRKEDPSTTDVDQELYSQPEEDNRDYGSYGLLWDEEDAPGITNMSLATNRNLEKLATLTDEEEDTLWDSIYKLVPEKDQMNLALVQQTHLETYGEFPNRADIMFQRDAINYEVAKQEERLGKKSKFAEEVTDGRILLDKIIQLGDIYTSSLAKAIATSPTALRKLKGIKVEIGGSGSFQRGDLINIGKGSTASPSEWLHELQHSLTDREVKASKVVTEDVKVMRRHLGNSLVREGILTSEQIKSIEGYKGDAKEFTRRFKGTDLEREYGYALVNNTEFLGQMFSSRNVQEVSKRTQVAQRVKSVATHSIWKRFTDMVTKIFKIPKSRVGYETLLEQSMKVSSELWEASYSKREADVDTINSSLTQADREATPSTIASSVHKKKGKSLRTKTTEQVDSVSSQASAMATKFLVPVSDVLHKYSKKLKAKLGRAEGMIQSRKKKAKKDIQDFLNEVRSKPEVQQTEIHISLMQGSYKDVSKESGISKASWDKVQGAFRTLHEDASNVGLTTDYKENYFPRRVADMDGWIELMSKDSETKGMIEAGLKQYAKSRGKAYEDLTASDKSQVVSDLLTTGKMLGVKKPGALKRRTAQLITEDTYGFYMGLEESIDAHINEMTEKTAMRWLSGGSLRNATLRSHEKLVKRITQEKDKAKREEMIGKLEMIETNLSDLEHDVTERGLAHLILTEMGSESLVAQREVTNALRARMNQQGAHGIVDAVKNVGYAMTMGNFTSTITQIPEGGLMFVRYGLNKDTARALAKSLKSMGKLVQRDIFNMDVEVDAMVEHADFSSALREYSSGSFGTGRLLETLFKWSGLKHMDLLGKEVMMRGAMAHYANNKNDSKFMEKYTDYFGSTDVAQRVLRDIKSEKVTDETIGVMMYELSDYQPVSLSQYSQGYLEGGNMRVLYSLKGFTLRTTNAAIRDAMDQVRDGEGSQAVRVAKGAKALASIIGFYALMGAGTDDLKDLLKGRDTSFSDNVIDNTLGFMMLNRFAADRGLQSDNLMTSIVNAQLPPLRWMDNFLTDFASLTGWTDKEVKWKSMSMFPIVGNLLYAHSDSGRDSWSKVYRKEIKKAKEGGATHGQLADMIQKYNQVILPGETRLTMNSLREK